MQRLIQLTDPDGRTILSVVTHLELSRANFLAGSLADAASDTTGYLYDWRVGEAHVTGNEINFSTVLNLAREAADAFSKEI